MVQKKTNTTEKKKPAVKPVEEHKSAPTPSAKAGVYIEGIGRRKVAFARVRIQKGSGKASVVFGAKELPIEKYLQTERLRETVKGPFRVLDLENKFDFTVSVHGGGITGQAEAIRLGIARALVELNPEYKKQLRASGFLTRDARAVERKKYGLKKARRAPQWSKR